jgi:hypothetical protein
MLDWETFLITLYVMVDDFCQQVLPSDPQRPGRRPALTPSEGLTLSLLARHRRFASERDFYRFALRHLRGAFPRLPHRSQFNRHVRRYRSLAERWALHVAAVLGAADAAFEALDKTAVPTRNLKRRGRGWLPGQADRGCSGRLGYYHGFALLLAVHPAGSITGWGFGPGSSKDQTLAEVFFAARQAVREGRAACVADPEHPGLGRVCLESVGAPATRVYLTDQGFVGRVRHRRWREQYGAEVLTPPQECDPPVRHPWPKGLRRVLAGMRQIVETITGRLEDSFGILAERPHTLGGFAARLAARVGLLNFSILLNRQWGRPNLAFADLVDWGA